MKKNEVETASFLSRSDTRSECGRWLEHLKPRALLCLLPGLQHISGGSMQRDHYWLQCWFDIFVNDIDGGKSAPSPSLQKIQNWNEWLVIQMSLLSFRGTSTGWRNGMTGILWSLTKRNAKSSYPWGGTSLCTRAFWGPSNWKGVKTEPNFSPWCLLTGQEVGMKTEPGFCFLCPVKGQEALGTNRNAGNPT